MYGRPGDNPINDVIKHGLPAFGEPLDSLIRQIGQHQYAGMVKRELESLCDDYYSTGPATKTARAAFETGLIDLIDRLENESNR